MTDWTSTATIKNADNSNPPDGSTIDVELMTKGLVSGGRVINDARVSFPVTSGTANLSLAIPDDATKAARYHFRLPDKTTFYASISQNSPTNWVDFFTTINDATLYEPSVLNSYLLRSGNQAGATSEPQTLTLGSIVPDIVSTDMTIPAGYHMVRTDLTVTNDIDVIVEGNLVIIT